jgi:beta-glucosidase
MPYGYTPYGYTHHAQVLQLYLSYPEAAGEPLLVLRAYSKTEVLAPGESAEVHFQISRKELSIWSEEIVPTGGGGLRGGWQLVRGAFTAHVGTSSRDENVLRAEFTVL